MTRRVSRKDAERYIDMHDKETRAIQRAYDTGDVAQGQSLNVQVGVARGGSAESGGAVLEQGTAEGAEMTIDFDALTRRNHEQYGTDVRCPTCNAGLGRICRDEKGNPIVHPARLAARSSPPDAPDNSAAAVEARQLANGRLFASWNAGRHDEGRHTMTTQKRTKEAVELEKLVDRYLRGEVAFEKVHEAGLKAEAASNALPPVFGQPYRYQCEWAKCPRRDSRGHTDIEAGTGWTQDCEQSWLCGWDPKRGYAARSEGTAPHEFHHLHADCAVALGLIR